MTNAVAEVASRKEPQYRFAVWEQELNSLWLDDRELNTPHNLQKPDLLGVRINLWSAFALRDSMAKHDHAIWITDMFRGNCIVTDLHQYSQILEIERLALYNQTHSESFAFGAVNRRIDGKWEEAAGIFYSAAESAWYSKDARLNLFQLIGDGCAEDEVDCEPLPERCFELDQAQYMGDGYWADYPPLDFATFEELQAYISLHNAAAQTGPTTMKIRGWRVIYK